MVVAAIPFTPPAACPRARCGTAAAGSREAMPPHLLVQLEMAAHPPTQGHQPQVAGPSTAADYGSWWITQGAPVAVHAQTAAGGGSSSGRHCTLLHQQHVHDAGLRTQCWGHLGRGHIRASGRSSSSSSSSCCSSSRQQLLQRQQQQQPYQLGKDGAGPMQNVVKDGAGSQPLPWHLLAATVLAPAPQYTQCPTACTTMCRRPPPDSQLKWWGWLWCHSSSVASSSSSSSGSSSSWSARLSGYANNPGAANSAPISRALSHGNCTHGCCCCCQPPR
jgi:hypothetical protein